MVLLVSNPLLKISTLPELGVLGDLFCVVLCASLSSFDWKFITFLTPGLVLWTNTLILFFSSDYHLEMHPFRFDLVEFLSLKLWHGSHVPIIIVRCYFKGEFGSDMLLYSQLMHPIKHTCSFCDRCVRDDGFY